MNPEARLRVDPGTRSLKLFVVMFVLERCTRKYTFFLVSTAILLAKHVTGTYLCSTSGARPLYFLKTIADERTKQK